MRADLLTPVVEVVPGTPARLELELCNTGAVIDEIACSVPGLDPSLYTQSPAAVRLFPGEQATVSLLLELPPSYAAGEHDQRVEVRGLASGSLVATSARLDVAPVVKPVLEATPAIRTGGRRGRFDLTVTNRGNDQLDVVLGAMDTDQLLKLVLEPARLVVPPGGTATARLTASRRRRWFGPPVTHAITVRAEQLPVAVTAEVQFRQKPRVPAGALTALTLLAIVGLWAVAVLFGVRAAMGRAPVTKLIPAGFAKGVDPASLDPTTAGSVVGGKLGNSVTGAPLARLTVELFDAGGRLVAATATKEDGSWELPGVLPGRYKIRISGEGFDPVWLPGVSDAAAAEPVTVPLPADGPGLPALAVAGRPGSVAGLVLAGDSAGLPVTVTVEPVDAGDDARVGFPRVVSAAGGTPFTVADLPAPAIYRVRVAAPGFQSQEVEQAVAAGATAQLNTVRLLAGTGAVGGLVVDRTGTPLGDVTVSTRVGEVEVKVQTPTSGTVGRFRLDGLPSPGTYVLRLERPGYGTEVVAVQLGAGQDRGDVDVTLAAAAGAVTGTVRGPDGVGLGGVRVAVVGGATEIVTTTFTNGTVGAYRLSGLALPGTYTLTYSLDGYGAQTMQVVVSKEQADATADVVLAPELGRVTGTVVAPGGVVVGGAEVLVSDGTTLRTTATATTPAAAVGTFDVTGLPVGTYTVTVRNPGSRDQTVLVSVAPGATVALGIALVDAVS